MIKSIFDRLENKKLAYITAVLALFYALIIAGCGGGGGTAAPAGNSYTPKTIEISGSVDGAAAAGPALSARNYAPINFGSECEIKAFDVNGSPIYGAGGYFVGNTFTLSLPLTEDYGRYLLVVARLKTGHEIYKRLLGRIPRYDDAASAQISVSNLRLNEETTAKALILLEDRSKMPANEITSSSVKTRFEIESETVINDADSTRLIGPLKSAIATVIKVMKYDSPDVNPSKSIYLSNVSSLLNSFVAIAKAREKDPGVAAIITETPQITLNGKAVTSSSSASDIASAVGSINETVKPLEVETPFFTPAGGVFESAQSVAIGCATSGATIKYALYGNTPSETYGIIYTSPISVKESMSIKAIAIKSGLKNSRVAEAAYTILNNSVSPLSLDGVTIGDQNGPLDYIFKNGYSAAKNFEISRPYFEIEFKRADGADFALNQTQFLRMRLKLIKTLAGGAVQEFNYAYGFETQAGEIDFSEDFGAPVISGRRIKFNYKTNALRPVSDASYEMRLVELQNVSYTNSSGFLYNYSLAQNVAGFFNIFTAAQTKTAEPVFSPAAGSFDAEIYASMSCATPGATVRYTLDSSTPSQSHGTIFNNVPILIASSTVVKAVAYKEGLLPSAAVAASYVINKVSAPEFSPAPGVYSVPKQITLTSKTPGASIYYTEDASANPSRSSALYQGPFFISSSKVIKAVAVKDGMKDSNIVSAEYVINKTEAPQFNPPSGTYASAQNITLFSQTAGAVIRYTTDGSEPNDSSPAYSGPIAVSNVGTNEIKAVAYKNGLAASAVSSAVYVILARVETPSFNPAPGIYDSARDVAITCATVGASIYYSLDGSAPSRSSALYTAPVRVASSLKLSAIAVKSGMADSFVESGAYTINVPQVSKPVIYPSSGTYGAVQHVTISCVTAGASIYYTLDETVPTASSTPYSGTIEVSQTSYIKAVAVKPGMLDSPHAESYIIINMPRPKVENPQFSPAAGSYTGAQQAAITCATAGSEIYYTLDGSRPTSSKTRYTAPFSVTANSTVKAIAIKQPLLSDSDVVTAEYFIRIPKPSFSLPAGDYTDEKTLILSTGVQGASIYYTTNGSEPTADYQNLYSAPIVISRSMTVKAMAAKPGMLYSETATAAYVLKVKMPSFAPPAGNYMDTQSVTISCQTPNAAVHYTIDGSEPTAASALFTSPIIVAHNLTIKAVGVKSGLVNSDVAVAAYTVQPKAAKPQLIPPGGVYNSARSVTITTATAGAAVKYTLDGTEPSISSATYSGAINVSAATEIRAIAVKSGMLNSDTARETYVIDNALQMVETPSFAPPGGVYNSAQNVTISSATSGADIYYTLDGSYPGVSSQKYLTPLSVDSSRTIRAIAVKQGMAYSAEASASYVIKAAAPSFTPAAGTYNGAQNITITSATAGAIIKYTLDGSEPGASVGLTYSQPVAVTQNVTLKAIAIKNGMANSDVSSAAYSIRVEAPVMSLDTGTYEGDRSVAITCATPGASIRYTTDGSDPSSVLGAVYASPVSVTATTTLKAIAYKNNMLDSAVTSKTYTMKTAAPVFTPAAGAYDGPKTISMSCATTGAVIYYTTNGDAPTVSSAQYGAPFSIDSTQTIKAFAQKAGLADSTVTTALYTISVPAPVITPASGTYQSAQSVTITCAMPGASIHYTTDGSNPTASSAQYTSPINVAVTTTVKAIAVKAGAQTSGIASAVYTIGVPVATPVFTPPGGSYNSPQTVTISCATDGATIYYTTNGSDPTTASAQYTAPLNVSSTVTIKAMAAKAAMVNSQVATAVYNITLQQVAAPVFTPAGGAYISAQSVAISCATAGADIYYTTDGSTPTTASSKYESAFNVAANTTVKAFAVKAGMTDSPVASAVYTISTVAKVVNVNYNSTTKNVSWDPVSVPGADSVKYYYKGTATIAGMGSQAIPEGSTTETSLNAPGLVPDSVNVPGIGVISLIGKTIDVTLTIQAAAIKNTTEVRGAISDPCSFTFVK